VLLKDCVADDALYLLVRVDAYDGDQNVFKLMLMT
jgi:hypothetical protein